MPAGFTPFQRKFGKKPASIQNEIRIYYISIFIKILVMWFEVKSKNVKKRITEIHREQYEECGK